MRRPLSLSLCRVDCFSDEVLRNFHRGFSFFFLACAAAHTLVNGLSARSQSIQND